MKTKMIVGHGFNNPNQKFIIPKSAFGKLRVKYNSSKGVWERIIEHDE